MFFHSADGAPERAERSGRAPGEPAAASGLLFTPYKLRLNCVLLLIVVTAALGVVPAFLLKRALEAITANDTSGAVFRQPAG